jgi:hypothetical protein
MNRIFENYLAGKIMKPELCMQITSILAQAASDEASIILLQDAPVWFHPIFRSWLNERKGSNFQSRSFGLEDCRTKNEIQEDVRVVSEFLQRMTPSFLERV